MRILAYTGFFAPEMVGSTGGDIPIGILGASIFAFWILYWWWTDEDNNGLLK